MTFTTKPTAIISFILKQSDEQKRSKSSCWTEVSKITSTSDTFVLVRQAFYSALANSRRDIKQWSNGNIWRTHVYFAPRSKDIKIKYKKKWKTLHTLSKHNGLGY